MVMLLIAASVFINNREKKYPFDQVAENWAFLFNRIWDQYEMHSLEVYFMKDDILPGVVNCYAHAKYAGFVETDEDWAEIDEVYFGDDGLLYSFYCLSWDSIEEFEDVNAEYERAVKEGVKKVYTPEEIEALLEKNR